ncbi:MFS transporter [Rhodococcus pyridinivorans]|uniref:MFS transporter n=1 Tax=Rhodococcus pyridinivorans TaxID=103816 RepID=UPI00207877E2|nr:MFS transporter [Rhodococcus pyridinivorans]USI93003.1 MHS family MFS transporter [Rhodococcus pyridinivorans]
MENQAGQSRRMESWRVLAATTIGTTIEWYDFFIYSSVAALVMGQLFFSEATGFVQTLLAFATVGISFVFRPLGAFLAGHMGDVLGRRTVLVATLLLMGGSTLCIGLLPTYAQIGSLAPVLLIVLRILQGISAGGEWGGAALMSVEHAPPGRRGLFGAFPQIGAPAGVLLSTGVLAILTGTLTSEQFLSWGWRVPFLISVVLLVVGLVIRRAVDESPVFQEIADGDRAPERSPVGTLFRLQWREVLLATLFVAGVSVTGYLSTGGYLLSYTTTRLGLDRTAVLNTILIASTAWIVTTLISGHLSDRLGRAPVMKFGFVFIMFCTAPVFLAAQSGDMVWLALALVMLTIGHGATYGPQSVFLAETFGPRVRLSGVSISYALGAIIGGAFAPMIATWLLEVTGTSWSVVVYWAAFVLVSLAAVTRLPDRTDTPLGLDGSGPSRSEEAVHASDSR